jgi:hypothetical protein
MADNPPPSWLPWHDSLEDATDCHHCNPMGDELCACGDIYCQGHDDDGE